MVDYISTDDLWRKWARDRGLTAPASTDIEPLARDYYEASDVDAVAHASLRELLASEGPSRDAVASATERAHEARARVVLVEGAIESVGGWVDPYRSTSVVMDAAGRPVHPDGLRRSAVESVPVRTPSARDVRVAAVRARTPSVVGR